MKGKVKQGGEREARHALGQNQKYADTDRLEERREVGALDLDERLKVKLKAREKETNQPQSELQRRDRNLAAAPGEGEEQGEGKQVLSLLNRTE